MGDVTMKSNEWNRRGYQKHTNPSGEVIRTKTYTRILVPFDNVSVRSIVSERKKLAKLLQVPYEDLLATLIITVEIKRYPKDRRFLKHVKSYGHPEKLRKSI
jgi:hypothetical protein